MPDMTPCPVCGALGWIEPCSSCRDITEADRDRAVLARIGGAVYRGIDMMPHSRAWDDDTYHASARAGVVNVQNNRKASRRAYLPEAAFDWPIYRAAVVARIMADGPLPALALLFPDPLTRPLYTIGDMEAHADRVTDSLDPDDPDSVASVSSDAPEWADLDCVKCGRGLEVTNGDPAPVCADCQSIPESELRALDGDR